MFEIALKLERNFVLGRSAEGLPVSFASLYRYNMHQLRKGVKFFNQSICSKYLLVCGLIYGHNSRHVVERTYHDLRKIRTNNGKFSILFQGPVIWNSINKDILFGAN